MDQAKVNERHKQALKELIRRLHQGQSPQQLKKEFEAVLRSTSAAQIAQIEQQLIQEGMPREELMRLCDLHMLVFKDALDQERPIAPAGHPIHILMSEHRILLDVAGQLESLCGQMGAKAPDLSQIEQLVHKLKDSASHYLREENVLFPYLERHGITEPPAIMWAEHDKIRDIEKQIYGLVDESSQPGADRSINNLKDASKALLQMLTSHFQKENHVLFPTALKVISEHQWPQIRQEFDQIGYCCFTPGSATVAFGQVPLEQTVHVQPGQISLQTGTLLLDELEAMLNSLPFDITFVDKDDTVRYFSQPKDRIFLRTKAVIGRKVQQCHPQKSIHIVNQILDEFRAGKRDVAAFWINLKGRLIYIRYFPVRDASGQYLGCAEVTEDITDIKNIEGEKRLL